MTRALRKTILVISNLAGNLMHKKYAFSLIELMICIGILMVLSTLAYPLYEGHIARTYRQQAQIQLLRLAQDLEIYHGEHQSYLGFGQIPVNAHYEIKITGVSEDQYSLEAIPKLRQTKDDRNCGVLILDNTGKWSVKGKGNLRQCWPSG
jgi:type IV pilus assembly protein PilE